MTGSDIVALLRERGPMTGRQLVELLGCEAFPAWRMCCSEPQVQRVLFSRRFLRLDRRIPHYARLSPSIQREFLSYTALGVSAEETRRFAEKERQAIEQASREKEELARQVAASVMEQSGIPGLSERVCFLLAGDVVYAMAHRVPRPEPSTGEMVRGSDLDIVVVLDDEAPPDWLERLDETMYRVKHYLLVHPQYREELDYVIKDLRRVRGQVAFDGFENMVACKILHEGKHLAGNPRIFQAIKSLLAEHGIPERLAELEAIARVEREANEKRLLQQTELSAADSHLFLVQEEREEIY